MFSLFTQFYFTDYFKSFLSTTLISFDLYFVKHYSGPISNPQSDVLEICILCSYARIELIYFVSLVSMVNLNFFECKESSAMLLWT